MDILYFAYGSNLSHSQMSLRCPGAKPEGPARLMHYKLVFAAESERWGGAVADIRPDREWYVQGGIYRMTESDMELLDKYEGYPDFYKRMDAEVLLPSGELVASIAYHMAEQSPEGKPSKAYLQTILRGFEDFGIVPPPEISAVEYID